MDCSEALKALKDGKKVKRREWEQYIHIDKVKPFDLINMIVSHIIIFNKDGTTDIKYFKPTEEDLLADDWEIIDDIPSRCIDSDLILYIKCSKCSGRVPASFFSTSCKCVFCGQETKIIKSPVYVTVPFIVRGSGIHIVSGCEHETIIELNGDF